MKIAVVLSNVGFFRHFERVVRQLAARGHTVDVVIHSMSSPGIFGHSYEAWRAESGALLERAIGSGRGWRQRLLWQIRDILNYAVYFRPGHPSPGLAGLWQTRLPRWAEPLANSPITRKLLVSRTTLRALRRIERAIPVDRPVTQWLRDRRPDVVFASSCLLRRCAGTEYIRGAAALGIPTVAAPASWDNLSTKGAMHVVPDVMLIWNDALKEEAEKLHDIPGDGLVLTGAPPFDYFFDPPQQMDRNELCEKAGIDPDHPFVLHVCSHKWETENEVSLVEELAERFRSHPGLKHMGFVVRPHPSYAAVWRDFDHPFIRLWPRGPEVPNSPEKRRDYLSVLYHASAVTGINTSAMIDAACMDKPCVTITDARFAGARLGHYRHLDRAGFLESGKDVTEMAELVARIIGGLDARSAERREFVRSFVRGGIVASISASEATSMAIENAALGKAAPEIEAALCWQRPSTAYNSSL